MEEEDEMPPKEDIDLYRSDTMDDVEEGCEGADDEEEEEGDSRVDKVLTGFNRRKNVIRTGRPITSRKLWKDFKSEISLPSSSVIISPGSTPNSNVKK